MHVQCYNVLHANHLRNAMDRDSVYKKMNGVAVARARQLLSKQLHPINGFLISVKPPINSGLSSDTSILDTS